MKCKLCLKDRELLNSHIIPEFCYKTVYDEKHRLHEHSTVKEGVDFSKQKGIREKLLCFECEQQLSKYEKYVREVFYGGTKLEITDNGYFIKLANIDYKRFKLFQLSIIWRASIANNVFFESVKLGEHEEIIRKMLIEQEPGKSHKYGCCINSLITGEKKIKVIDNLIMKPEHIRMFGHNCYRFIFIGSMWLFIISNHSQNFPYKKLFIKENGTLILLKVKAEETEYFQKLAQDLNL